MTADRPLAIDLCAGLCGWGEGLISEGWRVRAYDIEDMFAALGEPRPEHIELVLRNVLEMHGSEIADADLIVASPPCTEYSYMAMPWSRAKQIARALRGEDEFPEGYRGSRTVEQLNAIFDACFRLQREASEAAGRHIPMVVENVRGAEPWVGRAAWRFGSYYLWGDVPALMPKPAWDATKVPSFRFDGSGGSFQSASVRRTDVGKGARFTSRDCGVEREGKKGVGIGSVSWGQGKGQRHPDDPRNFWSKSSARRAASAKIAKIPFPLSSWIARVYRPARAEIAA